MHRSRCCDERIAWAAPKQHATGNWQHCGKWRELVGSLEVERTCCCAWRESIAEDIMCVWALCRKSMSIYGKSPAVWICAWRSSRKFKASYLQVDYTDEGWLYEEQIDTTLEYIKYNSVKTVARPRTETNLAFGVDHWQYRQFQILSL